MATGKWSLFLLLGTISTLAGCGGGTTANVQNPPAPAVSQISIAFQPALPTSVSAGVGVAVTAVVNDDPTNSGVDWTVNCPNVGNCGTITPHTDSGKAATYNPPSSLSSNTEGVSIGAFATADHNENVSASINVNGFAGFLQTGTYIIATNGVDQFGFPYQRAAAIVLDGNGRITGGEQTVNFMNPITSAFSSVQDVIAPGTYFVGADGRGTLAINTPTDVNIGQQGVETFSLVALSSSQALLTKTDAGNGALPPSNESSVGTMDFQTPGVQVATGGYALILRGTDLSNSPIAFGGVLNIDGPQSISGSGSRFDKVVNGSGLVTPSLAVSGAVSAPDKFGTVQFNLVTDFGSSQLTAYVIDASHFKLIETDVSVGVAAGLVIGQGQLTGAFSTFSGTYTFGIFGQDLTGLVSTLAAGGSFTAGGGSLSNGSIDESQSGIVPQVQVTDGFSASYTVDPSGRVDTNSSFTFANTSNGTGPELIFYLTASGNPVLVLDADTEPSLAGGGVGTGLAYPSTTGAAFSGDYGLSFTQNFSGNEIDATGQICVNGSSVTCPLPNDGADTFSGTADITQGFVPLGANPTTGGFQTSAVNGRLTGTISEPNILNNPLSVALYLIDSSHGFFVETDGGANGANPGFLTFGYFAGRTAVCNGCP